MPAPPSFGDPYRSGRKVPRAHGILLPIVTAPSWGDVMRSELINSTCLKALLAGGAVAAALAAAGPALAADPPAANNQEASSVGEVVVTAQFRATQLQKTPLAISAVTGQQIQAMGETNVTDLARTVPNTVISPLGSGWGSTLAAFIRGVGLGDNILSFEPGVPIYV